MRFTVFDNLQFQFDIAFKNFLPQKNSWQYILQHFCTLYKFKYNTKFRV